MLLDHLQMDDSLGRIERYEHSSNNYWPNDRASASNGINRRKTALGYVISVSFAEKLTYNFTNLRSFNAYTETTDFMV